MSRLICLCDNGMNNSTVPSDFIAEIYKPEAIAKAINEKMELIDLWDEELEYWYCQECKRITVINRKTGKYLCSYSRIVEENILSFSEVESWQELLFWRDKEFYDAIEEDDKLKVEEFIRKYPSRYLVRLSVDKSKALVFSPQTKKYLFSYILDPKPDFSKLD